MHMTNVNAPDSLAGEVGRQGEKQNADILVAWNGTWEATQKEWRTAQTRLTLAGFKADLIDGDQGEPQLIVARWAHTKALRSLADVDEFLARVAPGLSGEAL